MSFAGTARYTGNSFTVPYGNLADISAHTVARTVAAILGPANNSTCVSCVSVQNIPSFSSFSPIGRFIAYPAIGPSSFSLDVASIGSYSDSPGLNLAGAGIFHAAGYADTAGDITLTSQGGKSVNVSFSATAGASAPEPASPALLGTGLVGAAVIARLRRRK